MGERFAYLPKEYVQIKNKHKHWSHEILPYSWEKGVLGRIQSNWNWPMMPPGMQSGTVALEDSLAISYKVKQNYQITQQTHS